jgi:plastocyanin
MKVKSNARLFLGFACVAVTTLLAQDTPTSHRVEQKNREFSVKEITIRPGETLEFCNVDNVTHNVFSRSKSNSFTIKTQTPGSASSVEFKDEGVTEVRCAIHPAMKLMVTVKK